MRFSNAGLRPNEEGVTAHSTARPSVHGAWFLGTGAVILASVGIVLRGSSDEGLRPVEPLAVASEATEDHGSRAPVVLRIPEGSGVEALGQMEAHWGERWDEVRALLQAQGKLPAELPDIAPWGEVAEYHRRLLSPVSDGERDKYYRGLMDWPGMEYDDAADFPLAGYGQATPASLAKHLELPELAGLDPDQVLELERHCRDLNSELDAVVRSFMEGIGQVVDHRFRTGTIEHGPLALPDDEAAFTGPPSFFGASTQGGGWVSRVSLYEEDHPDLALIKRLIDELKERRREQARAFALDHAAG